MSADVKGTGAAGAEIADWEGQARRRGRRQSAVIVGLGVLLVVVAFGATCMGRYAISLQDVLGVFASQFVDIDATWSAQTERMLLGVRLPRILAAILVGAALALSGATYQGTFMNPLVSPDLLGVSSGACVGASVAILMNLNGLGVQLFALGAGLLSVFITTRIPRLFKIRSNLMLVLSGVIVSGIMSSVQGFCKYMADPYDQLQSIVFWTMGSLSSVHMSDIAIVVVPMVVAGGVLIVLRWQINILSLGEHEAKTLGVSVRRVNAIAIVCSTVLTASAVCLCGTIGWVGLVIPHICRMLVGEDNRYLMPATVLMGGVFMLLVDTLARCISSSEIPLSILTGIIGGPLFLLIMVKRGMKVG